MLALVALALVASAVEPSQHGIEDWPEDWVITWEPAQLAAFTELIGDAPVVGLGESIHTVGGFIDARAQLIEHLIAEEGFRVVAMETPWLGAKPAEDYVASCTGSPVEAVGSVFLVFDDVTLMGLLESMCAWNQAHPDDPVFLEAFDVQDHELAGELLAAADPPDALKPCLPRRDEPPEGEAVSCLEVLAGLPPAQHRIELARRTLRAYWEAMIVESRAERYSVRDHGMADTFLARLAQHPPGTRAVVWAHNVHLSHGLEAPYFTDGTMGDFLREALGDDYRAIAFGADVVGLAWDWLKRIRPPRPSPTSRRLAAQGPLVVDDLTDPWWSENRAMGKERWVPVRGSWDGLVHLAHARPAIGVTRMHALIELVGKRDIDLCWRKSQYAAWSRARFEALVAYGLEAVGARRVEGAGDRWSRDGTTFEVQLRNRWRRWCVRLQP